MKKILSLDGGGIRGIIPAIILSHIEKKTKKKTSDLFDLIAGTSTGGILALGLTIPNSNKAPKYSADDLKDLYEKNGRKIFDRSFWRGITSGAGWLEEEYDHKPLEKVLHSYFGNTLLKSALKKVLISCYGIQKRKPHFFKSWRKEYNNVPMKKVARATSAAPTFFEPLKLRYDDNICALIDGGVFINNPAISAYSEAIRLWGINEDYIVISLGTGQLTREIKYEDAKGWGKLEWIRPVIDCMMDGIIPLIPPPSNDNIFFIIDAPS